MPTTNIETYYNNYKNFETELKELTSEIITKKRLASDAESDAEDKKGKADTEKKKIDKEISSIKGNPASTDKDEAEAVEKTLKITENSIDVLYNAIKKPIEAEPNYSFFTSDTGDAPDPKKLLKNLPSGEVEVKYEPTTLPDFKNTGNSTVKVEVTVKDTDGNDITIRTGEVTLEVNEAPTISVNKKLPKFTEGTTPDAKDLIDEDVSKLPTGCTVDYKDAKERDKFNTKGNPDVVIVLKDSNDRVLRELTVKVEVEDRATTIEAETGKSFPVGTPPEAKELVKGETTDDKVEYKDSTASEDAFKTEGTGKTVEVTVTPKGGAPRDITVTVDVVKENFFAKAGTRLGELMGNVGSWVGKERDAVWDNDKWKSEPVKNIGRAVGFVSTGVGAIAFLYKGIKRLFGGGSSDSGSSDTDIMDKVDKAADLIKKFQK